jgi:hypothetical protein
MYFDMVSYVVSTLGWLPNPLAGNVSQFFLPLPDTPDVIKLRCLLKDQEDAGNHSQARRAAFFMSRLANMRVYRLLNPDDGNKGGHNEGGVMDRDKEWALPPPSRHTEHNLRRRRAPPPGVTR